MAQIIGQANHSRRVDYVFVGGWDVHPKARVTIIDASVVFNEPVDGVWLSDHFGVLVTLDVM